MKLFRFCSVHWDNQQNYSSVDRVNVSRDRRSAVPAVSSLVYLEGWTWRRLGSVCIHMSIMSWIHDTSPTQGKNDLKVGGRMYSICVHIHHVANALKWAGCLKGIINNAEGCFSRPFKCGVFLCDRCNALGNGDHVHAVCVCMCIACV